MIGLDKGEYVSEQRANYKPQDLGSAQGDSKAIKEKNTLDHFSLGGTAGQSQVTTYQDEYRKDVENKNRMFRNQKG